VCRADWCTTGFLQLAFWLAAFERHPIELLLACDLDFHALGKRVGNRDADAMQAAGRLVDLRVEFAARMQRAHNHFKRGLALEFGVGINRNTAAIIRHADEAFCLHLDFDPVGVAGQRLVHGVVDDFSEQVMQRLFVGTADIHAGASADGLESLEDLDVLGGIAGLRARSARGRLRAGGPRRYLGRLARGRFPTPGRVEKIWLL